MATHRLALVLLTAALVGAWGSVPSAAAARMAGARKQDEALPSAPHTASGDRVVRIGQRMVRRRVIVRGSCYDYAERVFVRAGFSAARRERVYASEIAGPYADVALIAPGDWLFIVADAEREPVLTHSVIFVRWLDRAAGRAEVVSYAGNDARRPGGLVPYDLTRTYRITRPTSAPTAR